MISRRPVVSLVGDAPASPLDLEAVKKRLRGFEAADARDDEALQSIINAVTEHLQGDRGILGRSLCSATFDQRFEAWPCGRAALRLALAPVRSITSLKYFDLDGVEQTMSADDYEFASDGDAGVIRALDAWPTLDARRMYPITVRFEAGYGAAADVPAPLIEAMTLLVGQLYEHRDALGVDAIAEAIRNDPLIAQFTRASL